MTTPGTRRVIPFLLPLLAIAVVIGSTSTVGAATPPSIPPGYVQLVDDTGLLTVTVPDTWTDIDTVPGSTADGPVPWISASPDLDLFETSFDVPGVRFVAVPFTDDPDSLVAEFGLPDGACTDLDVTAYEDGVFVGVVQVGTSCGESGTASWLLVVASPADQAFTALVQVQATTSADDEAMSMILETFNRTAVGMVPGSSGPTTTGAPTAVPATDAPFVPSVSVPAGLGPLEVATTFLDALAAGDGATACAVLTAEEMTINFVEEAETCDIELTLQVLGQGDFWASVQIEGDETTSSPGQCGDEDPADQYVSLELQGPTDDGCLSISIDDGEWRIEDLSNSIWNQATADPSSTTSVANSVVGS
jgi:hypothetical protein